MENINFTKGIFRLWVLSTVCWIGISTYINFKNLFEVKGRFTPGAYDTVVENGEKVLMPLADSNVALPVPPKGASFLDGITDLSATVSVHVRFLDKNEHIYEDVPATIPVFDVFERARKDFPNGVITSIYRYYSPIPNWSVRLKALQYIFFPPLILLFFGLGGRWTLLGFKR